ncbi:B-cell receptor CD22-like [Clupea harengus]|uniref:B-cell receptor CD22-like n=1 Tax=Clupea harengus TaxID=7950 RepID=A0A8M1KA98_CLUHA|nr:B-cell receptor CD22-like [Clupea harengus]
MSFAKGPVIFTAVFCIVSGVLGQDWMVTYSSTDVCGVKGSFVDIFCTYSYPSHLEIRETFWYIKRVTGGKADDLSLDSKYQGRVEYLGDNVDNCTLRIKDLKESDTAEKYRFSFKTNDPGGKFSGSEVTLSLTNLPVTVSPETVSEGDQVSLTCNTTCSLSNNSPVLHRIKLYPALGAILAAALLLVVIACWRRETEQYAVQSSPDDDTYTGLNLTTRSPEYDTLANVKISADGVTSSTTQGSYLDIFCTYSYPSHLEIRETYWYIKRVTHHNTDNLSLDSKYRGRVEYLGDKVDNCTLRVKDLKESDTAETYRFRFLTNDPKGKFSGSEVSLSLTNLEVTVSPQTVSEGDQVSLTCITTCSLSNNPTYIWYRNSQPLTNPHPTSSNTLSITSVSNTNAGYYSCAVRGHEWHPSPSVCVLSCWSVTYTPKSICALKGSSVEFHSYYTYPEDNTITKALWFIGETWTPGQEPMDLIQEEHYHGRVNYYEKKKNNHTLRITDLIPQDSNSFRFRLRTDREGGNYSGGNVELSVTALQILMDPEIVTEGDRVTLTCNTTCSLSNNPTYIWYKNLHAISSPHTAGNTLNIPSVGIEDTGSYSCALTGHEVQRSSERILSVRYGPRNTSASVHPSAEPVEGNSVTLTCSSDANPPAQTYTWYKESRDQSSPVGSSQNISFASISSEQSGLYYCEAGNEIGQNRSPVVQISVACKF